MKEVEMKHRIVIAAAALAALSGCASAPVGQSELIGERYHVTNIDTYPVRIESVDGSSSTQRTQYVAPGMRRLTLQTVPGGAGFSDTVAFELDVKPCTRYYIVAVKANPLDSNFTPRVDYAMPLGSGCRMP
jgi:hypothetical protein